MADFNHFDEHGQPRMVDVSGKPQTDRVATASGRILVNRAAETAIHKGGGKKGDVLGVARLAAIMAVKRTPDLIPLCHAIPIQRVDVDFAWADSPENHGETDEESGRRELICSVTVQSTGRTGVEMEAMVAASMGCLTVYDMLKGVDRAMEIAAIRLESKSGGQSGEFRRT